VRHRYVHGGFAGTETRFSLYLPPAELYEGRFFQHITSVPDSEFLAQDASGEQYKIGFSIASGGSFLETNGGGASGRPCSSVDPTIAAYRANAAARYGRVVAADMYGEHRPRSVPSRSERGMPAPPMPDCRTWPACASSSESPGRSDAAGVIPGRPPRHGT
jgi:hypothetical protein